MVGLTALAGGACARAGSSSRPETPAASIAEALRLTGTREGLEALARGLRGVVMAFTGADVLGDADVVGRLLEREITGERLYGAHAAHLAARFDGARFERLLAVLREPLSRRMTELEVAAAAVGPDTMTAWVASVRATDAGRERLALARRIDEATAGTETTLAVLVAAGRGAVRAFAAAIPPGAGDPLADFRDSVAKLEPEIREQTVASLAFTYREATVAEVARYAETLESELGRWFSRLQRESAVYAAEVVTEAALRRVLDARRAPRT